MAWNQSDGNGNRDPWSNSGKQQGPPDLDEILQKLKDKLNQLLSGGGGLRRKKPPSSEQGDGDGGNISFRSIMFISMAALGVALLVWIVAGMYVIKEAEEGVVLRFGKYSHTLSPGFNWAPKFIDEVTVIDVNRVRFTAIGFRHQGNTPVSLPNEALMLTADENIVDIQFAIQYVIRNPADFVLQVVNPELTLRQAIESAIREVVGRSAMDDVITEQRDRVANEVHILAQMIIDRYRTGLQIESVNMQDAQPPSQVQEAFLDAIKAREDQERIINEAKAYAADVVPKARGEADAIHERALAYKQRIIAQADGEASRFEKVLNEYRKAPEVTRERLYLETIESVMANTSKVLIDIEGGNNLIYLPLDQLLKNSSAAPRGIQNSESGSAPLRSTIQNSRSRSRQRSN